MRFPKRLLIAIADGEHARFVRPDPEHGLQGEASMESFTAHKRSADLGSDRPGASFHSDSAAHHTLAPRHDPHTLEKETFAHAVAHRLNEAAANGKRSGSGTLNVGWPRSGRRDSLLVVDVWSRGGE